MIPLPPKPNLISREGNRAVFEIEGLYPGYGQTIGNSLRRVLLSSLKGAAVTSAKISGIEHEFTTIQGVMEDVVDIILNLKQLRFKLHEEGPFTINLSQKGEKEILGNDFKIPSQVELINKNAHIATLTTKKSSLDIEAVVESGLGYVPVEAGIKEKVEVGTIALDAAFSPVRQVNYEVENMRVGDRTDYNRVRFTVETDGSITPEEAFKNASGILRDQFNAMTEGLSIKDETRYIAGTEKTSAEIKKADKETSEKEGIEDLMKLKLDELDISSRTLNALREAGIKTVGGLTRKKGKSLEETGGLGEKGIQEIKKALGNLGITLKQ